MRMKPPQEAQQLFGEPSTLLGSAAPFRSQPNPQHKVIEGSQPHLRAGTQHCRGPREYSEGFVLPEQRGDTKGQGGLGRAWIFFFLRKPQK